MYTLSEEYFGIIIYRPFMVNNSHGLGGLKKSMLTHIIGPLKNRNKMRYVKAKTDARKAMKTKIRHAPPISAINLLKLAGA